MKKNSVLLPLACTLSASVGAQNLVDPVSKDNSAQCDCYLASGPDPGYFQYHRFWDFRNIQDDRSDDFTTAPRLLTDSQNNGDESVTSSYFNTSQFQADWMLSSGQASRNSPVSSVNTPQNIYILRNSSADSQSQTYLTLRAQRLTDFVSISEMESNQQNVLHASIRGRFRVIPDSNDPFGFSNSVTADSNETHPVADGAVFGFFTYKSDTQESDIEILTSDPTNMIRYSNQPDYDAKTDQTVPGASTQATLPDNTVWTEWLDHRLDWYDGVSRWYINDQLVLEKTLNVPTEPSGLILNLWSDGGNWSGNMTVGTQVTVGVQWIEMVFNTSGKVTGKRDTTFNKRQQSSCYVGCNIDSIQNVGFPEVAYNSSTTATSDASSHLYFSNSHSKLLSIGGVTLLAMLLLW